jgi:DNA-binding beta-propeller fold protein YncE
MLKFSKIGRHPPRRISGVTISFLVATLLLTMLEFSAVSSLPVANAVGPGLPNNSYASAWTKMGQILGVGNRGHSNVAMVNGYLFAIAAPDSGNPNGDIDFWDISNPNSPVKVKSYPSSSNGGDIREGHDFGFYSTASNDYVAIQTCTGVAIWDVTDVFNASKVGSISLGTIGCNDYTDAAWSVNWQAPYIFVAGTNQGVFIVDATNLTAPTLLKQLSKSAVGNFNAGTAQPIGNLLVVSAQNNLKGNALMDISDPANPVLLHSTTALASAYSWYTNGGKIYGAGGDNKLYAYSINSSYDGFTSLGSVSSGYSGGGYLSSQDNYVFGGFSSGAAQLNVTNFTKVNGASSGITGADHDHGTVLGNLVVVGNDHSGGSHIYNHSTSPDNTAPAVNMVVPKNGATSQNAKSRVGVTFTDHIEIETINSSNFIVRPLGGSALAGKYSVNMNIVNFTPNSPLAANTTYEVVITSGANAIKDVAGNSVATSFSSQFSTGATIGGGPLTCSISQLTPATTGTTVNFSLTSSGGTGTRTHSWNWGDGSAATGFSSGTTASKSYGTAGHYDVVVTVRDSATPTPSQATCTAVQAAYTPLTANKPTRSTTIYSDDTNGKIWTVNPDTNTVTRLSASTNAKEAEYAVGKNPRTLAQAPDSSIWVVNGDDANISVLDRSSGAVLTTIALPRASQPFGLAFAPDGSAAFVTLEGTSKVVKLNPSTRAITTTIDSQVPKPRGIAISANSANLFVSRFISGVTDGSVAQFNIASGAFSYTRTISVPHDNTADAEDKGRGTPNYLMNIAISPDGRRLWVPSKKDNTDRGTFRDGNALTFDSTVRTIVSQIDLTLTTPAHVSSARFDLNDRDYAVAVAFSKYGDYAFVAVQGNNSVQVRDVYDNSIVTELAVGRAPQGLTFNSDGTKLFVQNFMTRNVSVYDVAALINSRATTGTLATTTSTVATETLPSGVLAGKKIFYNAADSRMSKDKYISCASCHLDGGSDERIWDFTDRGEGLRNTTTLKGRGGMAHGRVHWTGNFDEIQDFENDIRLSFGGTGFLTDTQWNTGTRSNPLGDSKTGLSTDLDNLAAYVGSLNEIPPSPHRNSNGTLTTSAAAGKVIFQNKNCASCHTLNRFTNSVNTSSNPLPNVGTITTASGKRLNATLTGFDTPTLLGIWATAPYLHDGSKATLLDVINAAANDTQNRHGSLSTLTTTERQQLADYLAQIDSAEVPTVSITNLSVADSANAADWSIRSNIQNGDIAYGDRTYTISSVPATLAGSNWIRSANDSKNFTANPLVTFSIGATADVYVAWDDRATVPSWLSTWTNTGTDVLVNESGITRTMSLYKKNYAAGSVSLAPASNAGSVYLVIVK